MASPFPGGFKRESGKLMIKPGGTVARKREGLARTAAGSLCTAAAGVIARRLNQWPVDSYGRVVTSENAVAKVRSNVPLDAAGRVAISSAAVAKNRGLLPKDSSGKLATVEGA